MTDNPNDFSTSPDPALLVDHDGRINRVNRAACLVFGYEPEEFFDLTVSDLMPDREDERRRWALAFFSIPSQDPLLSGGVDLVCKKKDGTLFNGHVSFETAARYGENWRWVMIGEGAPRRGPVEGGCGAGLPHIDDRALHSACGQVGALVTAAIKLEAAVQEIGERLTPAVDFDVLALTRFDLKLETVHVAHMILRDAKPVRDRGPGSRFALPGTVAERVLKTRSPELVLVESGDAYLRKFPGGAPPGACAPFRSTVMVPVFDHGHIPGTIFMQTKKPNAYHQREVDLLFSLANSVLA